MIITFIISQQKTIPAIRALVETLSEKYGTQISKFRRLSLDTIMLFHPLKS